MADGKGGGGFLVGLVLGGLVGVAATIVFGPELNAETRRKLREEGLAWRERAAELATMARTEADVLADQTRALVADQRARLDEAIAEGKEAAAQKQRELRARFEKAQQEGDAAL